MARRGARADLARPARSITAFLAACATSGFSSGVAQLGARLPGRRAKRAQLLDEASSCPSRPPARAAPARSGARRWSTLTTRSPASGAGARRRPACRRGRRDSPRRCAPGPAPVTRFFSSSSAAAHRGLDGVAPQILPDLLQLLLDEELRVLPHPLGLRLGLAHDASRSASPARTSASRACLHSPRGARASPGTSWRAPRPRGASAAPPRCPSRSCRGGSAARRRWASCRAGSSRR